MPRVGGGQNNDRISSLKPFYVHTDIKFNNAGSSPEYMGLCPLQKRKAA